MAQAQVQDVLKVHHQSQLQSGELKITRITPYVILGGAQGGRIFLKGGKILDENGFQVEEPPWLQEQLTRMTRSVLEEIGFADRVPQGDTPSQGKRK
jgi:hypothetical protein